MDSEDWQELRAYQQEKRWANHDRAVELLDENEVEYARLSHNGHYRIGEYDYWATTGLFIHRKTKKRGRGIEKLLKLVKPPTPTIHP